LSKWLTGHEAGKWDRMWTVSTQTCVLTVRISPHGSALAHWTICFCWRYRQSTRWTTVERRRPLVPRMKGQLIDGWGNRLASVRNAYGAAVEALRHGCSGQPWLVEAIRLGLQRVSGHRIGPCPASAAEVAEFTPIAFSEEVIGVSQCLEGGMLLVDVDNRVVGELPTFQRQEPTG
jgi:hypothetical protein